jgi:hypothetical protein
MLIDDEPNKVICNSKDSDIFMYSLNHLGEKYQSLKYKLGTFLTICDHS